MNMLFVVLLVVCLAAGYVVMTGKSAAVLATLQGWWDTVKSWFSKKS